MLPRVLFDLLLSTLLPIAACSSLNPPQKPFSTQSAGGDIVADDISARFHPQDYGRYQHVARCPGINRSTPGGASLAELHLQYVHLVNPEATRTLLLVHGWPGLWSSWSNQILHFNESYSLLIPNLRGFGASTHPGDVQASGNMPDMVGDLACILEDAAVDSAVCVGHDWGGQVCWEMARSRPDLVEAVAAAVVPYIPSSDTYSSAEELAKLLPRLTYQIYFETDTKTAVNELNASIKRTLRAVFRTVESPPPEDFLTSRTDFLAAWRNYSELPEPPFFSREEEDYIVEQYEIQGFEFTLGFYTAQNRRSSFEAAHVQGNFTIPQPALSILPTMDPVADWVVAAQLLRSEAHVPHLTTATIPTAHWPQLERPQEFNKILETWLNTLAVCEPGSRRKPHSGSSRTDGEL